MFCDAYYSSPQAYHIFLRQHRDVNFAWLILALAATISLAAPSTDVAVQQH